jgi:probable F420-dependent oxidoreductase
MKFGVFLPVSGKAAGGPVLTDASQQAEELGYASVWAAERLVNPWKVDTPYPYKADAKWQGFVAPDVPFLEPLTCLAYMAAVTKNVQLGISVAVLPYRHPLYTARVATSIDRLSDGRMILGLGVGWMAEEFRALGVDFHKRGAMSNEQLEILNLLWKTDRPEYHGAFYDFPPVAVSPRPVQQPRFPVWTGGESEAAQKRAAKYANAWFSYFVHISADEMAAKWNHVQKLAADPSTGRDASLGRIQLSCCRPIDLTDKPVEQKADTLEGTPEQLIGALKQFQNIGVEHMALQFMIGRWPERRAKIERFAKEVMPALT